jgi:hypothetical protein
MVLEEYPENLDYPYWVVWDIVDVTGIVRYDTLIAHLKRACQEGNMINWLKEHNVAYSGVDELSYTKHGVGFTDLANAVQFHMMFADVIPSLY